MPPKGRERRAMSLVRTYDKMIGYSKKPRCGSCGEKGSLVDGMCTECRILCRIKALMDKIDEMIMREWRGAKRLEENIVCLEEEVRGLRKELSEFIKGETDDMETVYAIPTVPPEKTPEEEK